MIKRKKILLGSKNTLKDKNSDNFIDLELVRNFDEIKPSLLNNVFDLNKQYDKERNESLKFCLYGTVESKYSDTVGIDLKITSKNLTLHPPNIFINEFGGKDFVITTSPLSTGNDLSKNLYGKSKSFYSFFFEVKPGTGITTTQYIDVSIDNGIFYDKFSFPYIFYDFDGQLLDYGTQTTEINLSGETFEINNDFPFFYDKHWIKGNLSIIKAPSLFFSFNGVKSSKQSISEAGQIVTVSQPRGGNTSQFTGQVSLEFPSKFGREEATVVIDKDGTLEYVFDDLTGEMSTTPLPNTDYGFTPQTLKWGVGEKIKDFTIDIINDLYVENTESITFKLVDLKNVDASLVNTFELEIVDDDVPSFVTLLSAGSTMIEGTRVEIPFEIDKAVEVPDQYFYVKIDKSKTTAIIYNEIKFDTSFDLVNGEMSKRIDLVVGQKTGVIGVTVENDMEVEIDEKINFYIDPVSKSKNIAIGSIGSHEIIVKDTWGLNTATFIIPFDKATGDGVYRTTIFNYVDILGGAKQPPVGWSLVSDNASGDYFINGPEFTFMLSIINTGGKIAYHGNKGYKIYEKGEEIFKKGFAGFTEQFEITLPANIGLMQGSTSFEQCSYDFVFEGINDGVDKQLPELSFSRNVNNYEDSYSISTNAAIAGDANAVKYYMVSEIENAFIAIDPNTDPDTCISELYTASVSRKKIRFNGTAFIAKVSNFTTSVTARSFIPSYFKVSYDCGLKTIAGGQTLLPIKLLT